MPRGGARTRPGGPAADPHALRRTRDGKEWVKLRPAGRGEKPVPDWPIPPDPAEAADIAWQESHVAALRDRWAAAGDARDARNLAGQLEKADRALALAKARVAARDDQERDLWRRLWALPQAVVWDADRSTDLVALYVRAYLEAARPDATAGSRTLARQLADALLLTTPALHAMRYVIDDTLTGAVPADLTGEDAAQPAPPPPAGARSRFTVVKDEGEAS